MKISSNSIFTRFFISYIIILIIPIIIGSYLYSQAFKVVKEDSIHLNMTILNQGRDVIDSYLDEIDIITEYIAFYLTENRIAYVSGNVSGADAYRTVEIQKSISSIIITNKFLYYYYIYFKNGNAIITPSTFYSSPELFYKHYFPENSIKYEDWYSNLNKFNYHNYVPGIVFETNVPAITYFQSIPIIGGTEGCIGIIIPERAIKELLNPIFTSGGGWFYVIDKEDNIVTSTMPDIEIIQNIELNSIEQNQSVVMEIKNKKMVISYSLSNNNNWKYVSIMPYDTVMSKVEHIKNMTINIVIIILIVGILISLVLAYQYNKPFRDIMKTIFRHFGKNELEGKNDFIKIENAIDKLVYNEFELQEIVNQQIPLLRYSFFNRLILGEYTNLQEINTTIKLLDLNIYGDSFLIILIRLDEYYQFITTSLIEENQKNRIFTKNIIENLYTKVYMHDVDNDKIMILKSFSNVETKKSKIISKDIVEKIQETLINNNIKSSIGIGNIYNSLLFVHDSYIEAKQALDFITSSSHATQWFADIVLNQDIYYFPLETQQKIINYIKAGAKDEVNIILRNISNENFLKRNLSISMKNQFLAETRGIILKLLGQLDTNFRNDEKILKSSIQMNDNLEKTFEKYSHILIKICNYKNINKKSHNIIIIKDIMQYLDKNYMDNQISLKMLSEKFGINQSYLSFLFKEQSGENFSSYLGVLRINKACEMIKEKDIRVKEVASLVGYNSDISFRRAFKKTKFMSPSEFKQNQK